jgi:hypothetical protein
MITGVKKKINECDNDCAEQDSLSHALFFEIHYHETEEDKVGKNRK